MYEASLDGCGSVGDSVQTMVRDVTTVRGSSKRHCWYQIWHVFRGAVLGGQPCPHLKRRAQSRIEEYSGCHCSTKQDPQNLGPHVLKCNFIVRLDPFPACNSVHRYSFKSILIAVLLWPSFVEQHRKYDTEWPFSLQCTKLTIPVL